MNELFAIPESKSPRLKWIETNSITFEKVDKYFGGGFRAVGQGLHIAHGETEDEALRQYAFKNRIPLWNELDLPR